MSKRIVILPNGNAILASSIYAVLATDATGTVGGSLPPRVVVRYIVEGFAQHQAELIYCETFDDAQAMRDSIIDDWKAAED